MKIFSSEEIRAIDKYTIEQEGISAKELVDRVGKGVADEILDRWGIERRTVVLPDGAIMAPMRCLRREYWLRRVLTLLYIYSISEANVFRLIARSVAMS